VPLSAANIERFGSSVMEVPFGRTGCNRARPAFDSLRSRVMPAKVLGCPVVRPLWAVAQDG
jgi:hypothetical protein